MITKIKKKIAKKRISEYITNNTLDLELLENYQLNNNTATSTECNSYYFSAHSVEKKQSVYLRYSIRKDYTEVWFYYCEGNNKYYLEQNIYTTNPPIKMSLENNVWNIRFSGIIKKNHKDQVRCTLEGQFESNDDVIFFNNDVLVSRIASSLSHQKIDKNIFSDINDKYNSQTYYEQVGVLKAKMLLEGQHSNFSLPCFRNHIYGQMDWNNLNNHLRIFAINESNYVDFSMISSPLLSLLEFGKFKSNDKIYNDIINIKYERATLLKGTAPDNLNLQIELDNKQLLGVHVKKLDEITYPTQEENYVIIEATADFLISGKTYRGIIEAGFNKNDNKWFNNLNIIKYKE